MQEALKQPLNERFVLLSETCIPLYPASLVWAQLLSEARSRMHACAKPGDSDDENRRMTYRFGSLLSTSGLTRASQCPPLCPKRKMEQRTLDSM